MLDADISVIPGRLTSNAADTIGEAKGESAACTASYTLLCWAGGNSSR